jgi:hypothetical protein
MMAETCTEWIESQRIAGEVMDRDEKLIKSLERERSRLGADIADARRKMVIAMIEIEAKKADGRGTSRIADAPAFYMANIEKLGIRIGKIDEQIVVAREELHDIADLIMPLTA